MSTANSLPAKPFITNSLLAQLLIDNRLPPGLLRSNIRLGKLFTTCGLVPCAETATRSSQQTAETYCLPAKLFNLTVQDLDSSDLQSWSKTVVVEQSSRQNVVLVPSDTQTVVV